MSLFDPCVCASVCVLSRQNADWLVSPNTVLIAPLCSYSPIFSQDGGIKDKQQLILLIFSADLTTAIV